ncbi:hypothetical protein AABB24_033549 [Solanum stoloniferum]|uniref:Ubiquitin thioesterase OTU n=1 Tax=Solanum stoloniferum TaxID=62892 RepID=A0ABD2RRN6_9SOLN
MEGSIVRRVIPSDNSCLFNAVGYVMDRDRNKAPELRQMSPAEGAPEEFDQTIFSVQRDGTVGPAERLALNLVKDQQRKRSYTDTANFTLRCGVCQIGVIGQKEAVEHAQATGHVNFQEYK